MPHPTSVMRSVAPAVPLPHGVQLPAADVRTRLNEWAFRSWTESSRRLVRVAALLTSDLAAGVLGVLAVQLTWTLVSGGGRRPVPYQVPLFAMVFCLLPLALTATGAYAGARTRTDVLRIGSGVGMAALLGWVQAQLFGRDVPDLPNKTAYLYAALVIATLAWTFRLALDRVVALGYNAGVLQRRVLVVGSASQADALQHRCRATHGCEFEVVGRLSEGGRDTVVEKLQAVAQTSHVPYAGTVEDLEGAFSRTGAHGLIVASNLPMAKLEATAGQCFNLGATMAILPHALKQLSNGQLEVRQSSVGSLLQLRPLRLAVPQLAVKRTADIVVTLAVLLCLWPLFALLALAIKLDSRGPVFFSQIRAGVGGRPFRMLKFRTMRQGADGEKATLAGLNESGDPRLFKIRRDPRVTRIGRLLRRTSLDELPQLVNVLKGDMSLVGPRPFFTTDLADYERHHFERLHVLPGITGLWQVSGRSDVVDFEEVVRLDREYIENWTVFTDLRILLRTIPAALGRGAY